MSFDFEKIFVRFRGRVLGPITKEKFDELVKRGQIARDHELSPDGIAWKLAGDYPELFGGRDTTASQNSVLETSNRTEEWYVNIEGKSRGPYSLDLLQTWNDTGLLKEDTPVWIEGLPDWTTAGLAFKSWFETKKSASNASPQTSPYPSEVSSLISVIASPRIWIAIVAILGLITCALGILLNLFQLGLVVSSETEEFSKAFSIVLGILRLILVGCLVVICVTLLNYSGRLKRLQLSGSQEELFFAAQAHGRFWKTIGVLSIIVMILGFVVSFSATIVDQLFAGLILVDDCLPINAGNFSCGLFA
jgi:hypothetical protein